MPGAGERLEEMTLRPHSPGLCSYTVCLYTDVLSYDQKPYFAGASPSLQNSPVGRGEHGGFSSHLDFLGISAGIARLSLDGGFRLFVSLL